jgi:Flp pilus assembly protein TadG
MNTTISPAERSTTTRHGRRGTVTVEFGLAFLVFFGLVYGVMEFGRIVSAYNILAGAAREGARYAMVHGNASGSAASQSDIEKIVRRWAVGLDKNSVAVTATWNPGKAPGDEVLVQASYTLTPFTRLILRKGVTLKSSARMTISQ